MGVLSKQEEGLPNITGKFSCALSWGGDTNGAFKKKGIGLSAPTGAGNNNGDTFEFYASYSNPIYGKSDHVTPENYAIRIWLRTA